MYSDEKKNGNLSSEFLRQLAGLVRFSGQQTRSIKQVKVMLGDM